MKNELKHVSLVKPKRETPCLTPEHRQEENTDMYDLVSMHIADDNAPTTLPSVTPEHICEEYMPGETNGETRSITPVHIADEEITDSTPVITPVHLCEEITQAVSEDTHEYNHKIAKTIEHVSECTETDEKQNILSRAISGGSHVLIAIITLIAMIGLFALICNLPKNPEINQMLGLIFMLARYIGVISVIIGVFRITKAILLPSDSSQIASSIFLIFIAMALIALEPVYQTLQNVG